MSGWDWLHAGLEFATYSKAQKAQSDLEEMKTAAQIEAARRVLIEAMRNLVFDISRDIKLAEEKVNEFPQQVYIVSRSLDERLSNSGLSAEVFPDFHDKEYVFSTQKKISEVIEKSRSKIDSNQFQQAEICVKFISEMPMLQEAISAKSAKESLEATEQDWKTLSGRKGKNSLFIILGVMGLGISACVGLPLFFGGLAVLQNGDARGLLGGLFSIFISALMPVGSILFFVLGGKSVPNFSTLKTQREEWKKSLLPQKEWNEIVSRFGDLSSIQFKKLLEDRLNFLSPILGGGFQKYLNTGD